MQRSFSRLIFGVLCAATMTLAGCGGSDDSGSQSGNEASGSSTQAVNLIFGTGGTSGSYYPIGGALKSVFEKSDQVSNVQVVSTGASVQNINNIIDGTNQIAIVMSDVAYDAVNGNNQFEGRKADIAALAGLYPNVVQLVALSGSNINSVADLEGKRVGVGKVGSGVESSAKKVLEAAGLEYDDLAAVSHTGYADSVTDMGNGNLDAAFFTSGVPNSAITGLMQNTDVKFINVEGETASNLLESYPYYESYRIPAGAPDRYNLDSPVMTVAIRNLLIVPASMDDTVARDLTERFYDYLGSNSVSVAALKSVSRDRMNQNLVLPVHPGAQAFYETLSNGGGASQDSGSSTTSNAATSSESSQGAQADNSTS